MKKWLMVALLMALPISGQAQVGDRASTFMLFGGANTDSTEQASPWLKVRGASRVVLRTWSEHALFSTTSADSTFSDSLTTFTLLFSDSLGGSITGPDSKTYPVGADSISLNMALTAGVDSTWVGVQALPLPINKILRAPANGTGIVTTIRPIASSAAGHPDTWGVFSKAYMRVRVTPLRRMTVSGFSSTAGKRVNGLRLFKMLADVYYDRK